MFFLFATGCAAKSPQGLLNRHGIEHQDLTRFSVCVSYGCRYKEITYVTEEEWAEVVDVMEAGKEDSSSKERQRIGMSIGLLEKIIGPKVGTDKNKGLNYDSPAGERQLDCIADTVNSTIYLLLMAKNGLLYFHEVVAPGKRGLLNFNFPHHSAAIKDSHTHNVYVVDPWFHDNGHPAEVVPLELWMTGYKPD